jgi:filamentous hemagglutinin family protein
VIAGDATIAAAGGGVTISQSTARAIVNWQDFSIAAGQSVRFVQPDALSATLNRVVSGAPSSLLGNLEANGKVFLINPNGVVIGAGARIDAGGFLASTLDVSDADFLRGGDLLFRGDSTAGVQNLGAINALGGDVFLIARRVENAGTIAAANGVAGLAAGSEVLLTTGGNERVFVQATSAPGEIVNAGRIAATSAELKAAGGNAYALAINNSGLVRATGSEMRDGQVWLVANGGSVEAGGTLAASSADGSRGGEVRVLGERINIPTLGRVEVSGANSGGTVLIGGDFQGRNADVANARTTTIAAGARIGADATAKGEGGRVIVWSDETTDFAGEISARGGARGGDGGFAEVSGKATLRYRGTTDLRAAQGTSGTLLLDPKNIVVATGGADTLGANDEFGENPTGTSTIDPSAIATALDSASVVLQANNDITVSDPIFNSNGWENALTFQAGRSIAFNADVHVDGDLIAVANYAGGQAAQRDAGDATLTLASGMKLDNWDGSDRAMTLQFGAGPNGDDPAGAISLAGTIRNALGTLTIATNEATSGSRTISLGPTTTANLTVTSAGDITQTGALSMISVARTKLYAGTSDITLTDAGNALGKVDFTGGDVTLNHGATAAFTLHGTAAGNLTATATNMLVGATLYGGTSTGGALTFTTNNSLQFAHYTTGHTIVSTSGGASGAISIQAGGAITLPSVPGFAVGFDTQGAPVSLIAGGPNADLSVGASSITTNGGAITLRSNRNVLLNQATLTSGGGGVILNSDAGASGAGSITLAPNSVIRSNGGRVELAGGSAVDANGYLTGRAAGSGATISATAAGASGILVNGATIDSAGGAIRLLGQSSVSSASDAAVGVFIASATTIDAGTGTVLIDGLSRASGGTGNMGVNVRRAQPGQAGTAEVSITSANTTAGAITIVGQGPTSGSSTNSSGINLQDATSITATGAGGGITLTGTGGVSSAASNNGVNFENGTGIVVATSSGPLALNGTAGNAMGAGIKVNGTSTVALGSAGMSGALTLTSDTIDFVSSNGSLRSTGALLVQPLTPSQAIDLGGGAGLSLSQSAIDAFADGFESITIGRADGAGTITINAAVSFKDSVTLRSPIGGGSITVDGALSTGSGSEAGSLTLRAANEISVTAGKTITTAGQPVTLNADRDASGSGFITIGSGAAITTSGGAITLGGGSDPSTTAAKGATYGVRLMGALDAGIGAVTIRGEATAIAGNNNYGVNVEGGSVKTSGAGAITIAGTGAPSAGNTNYGVGLNTDAIIEATGSGGITILGTGGGATGSYYNDGVAIHWGSAIASATGAITITGTAGIATGANTSNGISFQGGAGKVESMGSAAITLTGTGVGSASSGLYFGNASVIGGASASGGITLTADTMNFGGSPVVRSSGALWVQPLATSTTIGLGSASGSGTLGLAQSALNAFADGFNSITIGRSDGSGAIVVGNAAFLDAVEFRAPAGSGAISIAGALDASVNRLTLNAAAGANQDAALTAGSLLVKGAGSFVLTNTSNMVGTLAANVTGPLSFTNGGALTIGSVDGTTGVSTGANAVTVRTTSGNLTVASPVTVSGAADLTLAAAGNFINSVGASAVSVGTGRWLVWSTNPANDTRNGLTEDFRHYNATFGSTTPGQESGNGFLYTFAPTVTAALQGTVSRTYDGTTAVALDASNFSVSGALDDDAITLSASSGGEYDDKNVGTGKEVTATGIEVTSAANGAINVYGYQVNSSASAEIGEITPAALTYVADTASRTYGAANPTFDGMVTGFVAGEDLASATSGVVVFSSAANGTSGVNSYAVDGSGLTANHDNYTFVQAAGNATALSVTPAPLTITANDATKTYGQMKTFAGTEFVSEGLQNGETIGSVTLTSTGAAATASVAGGPYAIEASEATAGTFSASNYDITYEDGELTVAPAALTITASDATKTYGQTKTFAGTEFVSEGLQNGETIGGVSLTSAGAAATASVAGGPYGIAASAATGGTFDANNYTISYENGELTVAPAALTVTANDATKTYGQTQTFTGAEFVTDGLQNDEIVGSVTLTSTGAAAAASVAGGPYAIEVSAATGGTFDAGNYAIVYEHGELTVAPAALTIRADDASKVYGQALVFAGTEFTVTGLQNEETIDSVTLESAGAAAAAGVAGGPYAIEASAAAGNAFDASNYDIVYENGALTVTPAPLTISADETSRTYGARNPAFTVSYDGFVLNEGVTALGGALSFATDATPASDVGDYAVTPSGLTSTNYEITFDAGVLEVTRAPLTVKADNASRGYGGVNPAFGATYLGFVLEQDASVLGGVLAFATDATTSSPRGNYTITPSGLTSTNYAITFVPGTLSIDLALLTIAANDATKLYGSALPNFGVSYSGFTDGDDASVLSGELIFTTAATAGSDVGSYDVLPGGVTSDRYAITFVPGTLSVTPAPLVVKANDAARVFRNPNPTLSASYEGFVLGQNENVLGGSLELSTSATIDSAVGSYPIVVSGLTSSNYDISFVGGTLSVGKAVLTVRANDFTKLYGAALPKFTASFVGFESGDTVASSVTGSLTFSTTATAGSDVGSYSIVPGGVSAANYAVEFVPGTLTISPAELTIIAHDATRSYGAANSSFSASFEGFVNGDTAEALSGVLAFATEATTASNVGAYTVTPTGVASRNYAITFVPGTLTVDPVALTITANDAARTYGAANPAFGASFAGFVNGDTAASLGGSLVFGTAATSASGLGSYAITASGVVSPNYEITFVPGTLRIDPAALTITAEDYVRVFGAPNPSFTARYDGLVNGETASVVSGLTFATDATPTSGAGTYAIVPGGATAANYAITFVPGSLVVSQVVVIVDDAPTEVPTVDGEPALTGNYAVVVRGDSLVLIPVDGTTGVGTSVGGDLNAAMDNAVTVASFGEGGATKTVGEVLTSLFGGSGAAGGQVVATIGGAGGAGAGGSLSLANVPSDQNLMRETTVNMGGFNVVYREAVDEVRQLDETNTAFGSSFREFLDSESPQVVIVRDVPGHAAPEEHENANDAGATL